MKAVGIILAGGNNKRMKELSNKRAIAAMPVPIEEASRFGVLVTDDTGRIVDFEEKPAHPRSNLASMGIYIFTWSVLREALITNANIPNCDFGMHVIPYCHQRGDRVFCYEYNGYWKDVGTLASYWEANMELIDIVPVFNLYEEYWNFHRSLLNQLHKFSYYIDSLHTHQHQDYNFHQL